MKHFHFRAVLTVLSFILAPAAASAQIAKAGEAITVNWYHRSAALAPVIEEYNRDTGHKVVVNDDYDTFNSDVVLVSDYKGLTEAKKFHHFQKLNSSLVDAVVPSKWRDRDGYWAGILLRVRAPIYNKKLISPAKVPTSWSDLQQPSWANQITLRDAGNVYNRSLIAWMLHNHGEKKTLAWARAVRKNAGAEPVYSGDTGNIGLVSSGKFPLSIVNTYYIGYIAHGWMGDDANRQSLDALGVAWMGQEAGGTGHPVNVTGAAINRRTNNAGEARRLIEWLVSKKGQALLSQHVFKYPVRDDVEPSPYLQKLGKFKMSSTDLNDLELHYDDADRILKEVDWSVSW